MLNIEREEEMNMKLREAREGSGMTQAQVAKKANVTERTYQYYESGKKEPGVRTAIRIAKTLGTTVEEIFPVSNLQG